SRFVDLSAQSCRKEDKHGAHLCAFLFIKILGDDIEERYRTLHGFLEFALNLLEYLRYSVLYLFYDRHVSYVLNMSKFAAKDSNNYLRIRSQFSLIRHTIPHRTPVLVDLSQTYTRGLGVKH